MDCNPRGLILERVRQRAKATEKWLWEWQFCNSRIAKARTHVVASQQQQ